MKLVILAATVFLSYAAFSLPTEAQYDDYLKNYRAMNGDVQGNGGDGIECDGKLETLDVYEARVMMPWMKPDFGIGSLNIEGKLRTIADRLAAA